MQLLSQVEDGYTQCHDCEEQSRHCRLVEKVYLPNLAERGIRVSTQKGYRNIWHAHLKRRVGNMTLREFRTVHGEQLLAQIAAQTGPGRNSLKHVKSFLSGVFKQAKRLGILDVINPMQDTSIPRTPEPEDTYAYSLPEVTRCFLSSRSRRE